MELIYSDDCPYCRNIARAVSTLDLAGVVDTIPIESREGRLMVEKHHGRFVHSPHLFTDSAVYYGVSPVAKGLAREYPNEALNSIKKVGSE